MCGFQPRSPLEMCSKVTRAVNSVDRSTLKHFVDSMNAAREFQADHMIQAQKAAKTYFDQSAVVRTLNEGDIVLMYSPVVKADQIRKFTAFFEGPMIIIHKSKDGTHYRVRNLTTGKIHPFTVNQKRLKRMFLPNDNRVRAHAIDPPLPNEQTPLSPDRTTAPPATQNLRPQNNSKRINGNRPIPDHIIDDHRQSVLQDIQQLYGNRTNDHISQVPSASKNVIPLKEVVKMTNIKKVANKFRYQLLLRGLKSPKWFDATEVEKLPQHMIDDILSKRTLMGLPRRSYVRNQRRKTLRTP